MKNRTLYFGEGLFETFRVYPGRRLAFVEDHLNRMHQGCEFFTLPFSRNEAVEALRQGLQEIPKDGSARLRLNLLSYGDRGAERTSFETTWEPIQSPTDSLSSGVSLTLAPFSRFSHSPLVRFKTSSYLENIFVYTWARKAGYFDALFTNERREITEGSITNVFFVANSHIFTPPIAAGLLPGVTRKQVIHVAQGLGIPLKETTCTPEDISSYAGAFVTNSVIEILPVIRFADTHFDVSETESKVSQVIRALMEGYEKHRNDNLFP